MIQIKEDSQASQSLGCLVGKDKMYNTSKQYKKTYHTLYNTLVQTDSQANQPEKNKTQVSNTNEHTATNPVIVQLAWQTSFVLVSGVAALATCFTEDIHWQLASRLET